MPGGAVRTWVDYVVRVSPVKRSLTVHPIFADLGAPGCSGITGDSLRLLGAGPGQRSAMEQPSGPETGPVLGKGLPNPCTDAAEPALGSRRTKWPDNRSTAPEGSLVFRAG